MRRTITALALLLMLAGPAAAHRLKLFVTVAGATVSGYAFFVGGGRPQGVAVIVRDAARAELYRGTTDDAGAFAWTAPGPADYTVSVDTGDGHAVEARIAAGRFSGAAAPAIAPQPSPPPAGPAQAAQACPPAADSAALAALIDAAVDRAVARQLRPLVEAAEAAESRLRLNDIVGGVGIIFGLAGAWLWVASRRRPRDGAGR